MVELAWYLISHTEQQHPQLQVGPDDLFMSLPTRAILRFYTKCEKVNRKERQKTNKNKTTKRHSCAETNGRGEEIGDKERYIEEASTGISS